ncbi:RNA ligase family protein [Riemerella anatipestifer]|uniref:RNA ligase family protein n=1 Tax=Riemerella anatipestifer TaxID=34085 RepID=UPI001BD9BD5C|nr:RNA ligase family protein [Riemerella anatipestifer]MBT0552319.1 hypothetical protein [Riemerella anatipestifer]MBT0554553.1 hypothetical protein [Riemerella anatipestifer]MCE3025020.1 RNA ligase family protein [Riemerella anatipestifer]MCU7560705.1 RNA ligase family protein [Riemerella anatipestifer]MDY3450077.1 RNA ligase family protein [Riemerella anatipestifer]
MKTSNIKNYGSIGHFPNSKLGTGDHHIGAGHVRLLTERKRDAWDTVFVHEKYDGSNVGIIKWNNQILALTRSGRLAKDSRFKQHQLFALWVERRKATFESMLQEGERVVGEWLAQAHGIRYKINTEPIVFFDYFSPENKRWTQNNLLEKLNHYELNSPRLLHKGDAISTELLIPILNQKTPTIESIEQPEGMVYRMERKDEVDFLAKWVRPDFCNGQYNIRTENDTPVWNVPIENLE